MSVCLTVTKLSCEPLENWDIKMKLSYTATIKHILRWLPQPTDFNLKKHFTDSINSLKTDSLSVAEVVIEPDL